MEVRGPISGPDITNGSFVFTSVRSGSVVSDWGNTPKSIGHSAWSADGQTLALSVFTDTPQVGLGADVIGANVYPISFPEFKLTSGTRSFQGRLVPNSLTIVDRDTTPPPPPSPGAIPEPAAWALLITGFGLIGATARRRRGHAVTA